MPRSAVSASDRSNTSAHLHAGGGPLAVEIAAAGLARLIAASADGRAGESTDVGAADPPGCGEQDAGSVPARLDFAADPPLSVPTGRRDESAHG